MKYLCPLAVPYFKPPFKYHAGASAILDANLTMFLDVRGYGHLTGKGAHGLTDAAACAIQDQLGEATAKLLNENWERPAAETPTTPSQCTYALRAAGKPYPRTCAVCGLGPCREKSP